MNSKGNTPDGDKALDSHDLGDVYNHNINDNLISAHKYLYDEKCKATDTDDSPEISMNTTIYRYFPKHRFFELFEEQKNALVRPVMWDDPFENFILRSPLRMSNGEVGGFGYHDNMYGQCWTLEKNSDAMWRIYSPLGDAVCVQTTVGKLVSSLFHGLVIRDSSTAPVSCFIGKVKYLTDPQLKTFSEIAFKNDFRDHVSEKSLLLKREGFEYEREVRLIFSDVSTKKHRDRVFKYCFNPSDVIERLTIDPKMSDRDYYCFLQEISEKTEFEVDKIEHSQLYNAPRGFIIHGP